MHASILLQSCIILILQSSLVVVQNLQLFTARLNAELCSISKEYTWNIQLSYSV